MIPFNFRYFKPDNLNDALDLYHKLSKDGKQVKYYGGGTEIISMSRVNNIFADAVIDYKDIPECNELKIEDGFLTIGSAATLTNINESKLFPLMGLAVGRIADHTIQNKITLGGNIAGTIIYKESILPLLVSDCEIELASIHGVRRVKINDIFHRKIELMDEELIVRVHIDKKYLSTPSVHVKRTKNEKIDYPLITMVTIDCDNRLRFAFSGLCDYPFRSFSLERIINDNSASLEDRLNNMVKSLDKEITSDISGSKEFRSFVLKEMVKEGIKELRG